MACTCAEDVRADYGVTKSGPDSFCGFCHEVVKKEVSFRGGGKSSSEAPVFSSEKVNRKIPTSGYAGRVEGITSIIRRMWIWIGAQAFVIGIWAGNAFPNVDGRYNASFSFSMFFAGALAGVGAFAPLVFVVEALREVVVNLIKGPEEKS